MQALGAAIKSSESLSWWKGAAIGPFPEVSARWGKGSLPRHTHCSVGHPQPCPSEKTKLIQRTPILIRDKLLRQILLMEGQQYP